MKEAINIKLFYISLAVLCIVSSETKIRSMAMKLFDAHCHLQDQRVVDKASLLIHIANAAGVVYIAVDGITEKDWHLVKEMSDEYDSVIPNFGLHPWYVEGKSRSWFDTLKELIEANPSAAVGEIGLDKSPLAKGVDFGEQVEVFKKQLQLAKGLKRPASVHCLDAFPELLQIMNYGNRTISSRCNTPFLPGISRGSTSTYKAWLLLFILWTFDAIKRRQGQKDCEGGTFGSNIIGDGCT
ncbi:hypothetical protein E1A91_A13G183300v1 [Gossypium mustelinum]|uniref:TatD related DNase n=1 Tax=Gossypium mustelinum TaxID=34275 RepID=A0A5D2WJL7_GOSMU|nr:hypothetical protein E1A91_A13G183300v1 [Gossypium mustelinum]